MSKKDPGAAPPEVPEEATAVAADDVHAEHGRKVAEAQHAVDQVEDPAERLAAQEMLNGRVGVPTRTAAVNEQDPREKAKEGEQA